MQTLKRTLLIFSLPIILFAQEENNLHLTPGFTKAEKFPPQYQGESLLENAGFGVNLYPGSPAKFLSFPIPEGNPLTLLNQYFYESVIGADIDNTGNYYCCTDYFTPGFFNLVKVNLTTGLPTNIKSITGFTLWATSLAFNKANSTWYFGSTDTYISRLYTLDVITGEATFIGQITNLAWLSGLAIDCFGNAYGLDLLTDQLFSIDLTTGRGIVIGPTGFDTNWEQDCDFDDATHTLFLTSFYMSTHQTEFRCADLTTGNTTLITTWPASHITGLSINNPCGPCSIGQPSNPNPPDGVANVSITRVTLDWINGIGTENVEVWFGPKGNIVKAFDGSEINSFTLPKLNYNTNYEWFVVCKDTTCATQGPTWSFTTMQNPNFVNIFEDQFTNLNCWTKIGPQGTENWLSSYTNFAGGNSGPELRFYWMPVFNGLSKLLSCPITTSQINVIHQLELHHLCDWYADPSPFMGIGISYDNGVTDSILWQFQPVGGNVGPESIFKMFTPIEITFRLILFVDGNTDNLDNWYVDDIFVYIDTSVVSVKNDINPVVTAFQLFQNYPNPFNPSTKIKFTIPSVETTRRVVFTTLKVYDVLGNEIATLVNEELPAGEYEVEFDIHSVEGRNLSSGIYFYRLLAGAFIETKSMVLLK